MGTAASAQWAVANQDGEQSEEPRCTSYRKPRQNASESLRPAVTLEINHLITPQTDEIY